MSPFLQFYWTPAYDKRYRDVVRHLFFLLLWLVADSKTASASSLASSHSSSFATPAASSRPQWCRARARSQSSSSNGEKETNTVTSLMASLQRYKIEMYERIVYESKINHIVIM